MLDRVRVHVQERSGGLDVAAVVKNLDLVVQHSRVAPVSVLAASSASAEIGRSDIRRELGRSVLATSVTIDTWYDEPNSEVADLVVRGANQPSPELVR